MKRLLMIALIAVYNVNIVSASTMGDVTVLLQDLFTNYSTDIRPVKDQTAIVNVKVVFSLVAINNFDEVTGVISVVAIVYISWKDESLVWDPTKYGNTSSVVVSQNKLWLPKMILTNPAEIFKPISNKHFKVQVYSNGTVSWVPGGILKATCTPDVSKFPFDQQICTLKLAIWGYYVGHVALNVSSPTILLYFYSPNSAWDITGSSTSVETGTFDMASFSIHMKRRPLNFLASVVIPIILLALVNPFVFILPFNSGERASYSITVLLAFTVYMTVVSDRMPTSSEPMSYISYYLLTMLAISVLIVTMNIFQMRVYGKEGEPVPKWIRTLLLCIKYLYRRRKVSTENPLHDKDISIISRSLKMDSNANKKQMERLEGMKDLDQIFDVNSSPVVQAHDMPGPGRVTMVTDFHDETVTWNMAAKIADKAQFVIFLLLTIIATATFFLLSAI